MRMLRLAFALAAVLAVATASLPARAAAPSGPPVVVGAILSISGLYAPLGEPERNALNLAQNQINAAGGIDGHPLQIVIQDDEGKADTAQQLATSFVGQKVAAIIGGSLTPTSSAIARVANASKVLQIYMTPTSTIWKTAQGVAKYTFEATPRNEIEAVALLHYARAKMGMKKLALIADEAPYGQGGTAVVQQTVKDENIDLVDTESFAINATDLTAQLLKIKNSGADTVLIWTASPAAATAVRQIRQLGLKVGIIGSTGIVSDNFLRLAGKDSDGVVADVDLNYTFPDAVQRSFLDAYHNAYKARPSNFASFAWDAAHLVQVAVNGAKGKTDGDSLAAALESMKPYHGTTGTFAFTASDHNGLTEKAIHIAYAKNQVWYTIAQ